MKGNPTYAICYGPVSDCKVVKGFDLMTDLRVIGSDTRFLLFTGFVGASGNAPPPAPQGSGQGVRALSRS